MGIVRNTLFNAANFASSSAISPKTGKPLTLGQRFGGFAVASALTKLGSAGNNIMRLGSGQVSFGGLAKEAVVARTGAAGEIFLAHKASKDYKISVPPSQKLERTKFKKEMKEGDVSAVLEKMDTNYVEKFNKVQAEVKAIRTETEKKYHEQDLRLSLIERETKGFKGDITTLQGDVQILNRAMREMSGQFQNIGGIFREHGHHIADLQKRVDILEKKPTGLQWSDLVNVELLRKFAPLLWAGMLKTMPTLAAAVALYELISKERSKRDTLVDKHERWKRETDPIKKKKLEDELEEENETYIMKGIKKGIKKLPPWNSKKRGLNEPDTDTTNPGPMPMGGRGMWPKGFSGNNPNVKPFGASDDVDLTGDDIILEAKSDITLHARENINFRARKIVFEADEIIWNVKKFTHGPKSGYSSGGMMGMGGGSGSAGSAWKAPTKAPPGSYAPDPSPGAGRFATPPIFDPEATTPGPELEPGVRRPRGMPGPGYSSRPGYDPTPGMPGTPTGPTALPGRPGGMGPGGGIIARQGQEPPSMPQMPGYNVESVPGAKPGESKFKQTPSEMFGSGGAPGAGAAGAGAAPIFGQRDPNFNPTFGDKNPSFKFQQPTPPGGNGYLADRRASRMEEINNNPALKRDLQKLLNLESGSQGKTGVTATFEAMMNRSILKGNTIEKELHSGFYGPVNRGMHRGALSESEAKLAQHALDQVAAGSNLIKSRTDQGSGNDPNVNGPGRVPVPGSSEVYNHWGGGKGHRFNARWSDEQERKAQEWSDNAAREAAQGGRVGDVKTAPGATQRIDSQGKPQQGGPSEPGAKSSSGYSQLFPGMGLPGVDQSNNPGSQMGNARGRLHAGNDYYTPVGQQLKAQGDGTVRAVSNWGGYGHSVVIQYKNGHTIQYSHLGSSTVKVGDTVKQGDNFAIAGASGTNWGRALEAGRRPGAGDTPPHVHLEMVPNEAYNRAYGTKGGSSVGGVGSPVRGSLLQPWQVFNFGKGGANLPKEEPIPLEKRGVTGILGGRPGAADPVAPGGSTVPGTHVGKPSDVEDFVNEKPIGDGTRVGNPSGPQYIGKPSENYGNPFDAPTGKGNSDVPGSPSGLPPGSTGGGGTGEGVEGGSKLPPLKLLPKGGSTDKPLEVYIPWGGPKPKLLNPDPKNAPTTPGEFIKSGPRGKEEWMLKGMNQETDHSGFGSEKEFDRWLGTLSPEDRKQAITQYNENVGKHLSMIGQAAPNFKYPDGRLSQNIEDRRGLKFTPGDTEDYGAAYDNNLHTNMNDDHMLTNGNAINPDNLTPSDALNSLTPPDRPGEEDSPRGSGQADRPDEPKSGSATPPVQNPENQPPNNTTHNGYGGDKGEDLFA